MSSGLTLRPVSRANSAATPSAVGGPRFSRPYRDRRSGGRASSSPSSMRTRGSGSTSSRGAPCLTDSSPVAMRITFTAVPITSAGAFSSCWHLRLFSQWRRKGLHTEDPQNPACILCHDIPARRFQTPTSRIRSRQYLASPLRLPSDKRRAVPLPPNPLHCFCQAWELAMARSRVKGLKFQTETRGAWRSGGWPPPAGLHGVVPPLGYRLAKLAAGRGVSQISAELRRGKWRLSLG